MLFTAATLRGLTEGRVNCTYRRWEVVRPNVGSRFTTSAGVVEVTSITPADEGQLTDQDAADAGFDSVAELVKWTSAKGRGDLYRIGIVVVGPDPRVALRRSAKLAPADVSALSARLTGWIVRQTSRGPTAHSARFNSCLVLFRPNSRRRRAWSVARTS
jgi:hypothetical protein